MTSSQKGALLSVGSALGAALFFIPFKVAGQEAERDVVVLAILLVGAVANTTISVAQTRRALRIDRLTLVVALLFGALTAAGNLATSESLHSLDAGMTSVLQHTQVLLVAAGSWLFLAERITGRFAAGAVIVIAGLVIMRVPVDQGAAIDMVGVIWALGSALCFAVVHVVTRAVIARIQPMSVNALRLWFSVLLLLCLPGNARELVHMGGYPWLLCAVAAIMGPLIGRICIMYAVRYISASHSALITLIGPVFAFALDWAILGRAPTTIELIGGAVIVAGIALPLFELAFVRRPAG